MFKSFAVTLFSFSLLFSLLAPPFFNMLDLEPDVLVLIDFTEEESQNKTEKGIEENKILINPFSEVSINHYLNENIHFIFYLEDSSSYTSEIHLPPPEFII